MKKFLFILFWVTGFLVSGQNIQTKDSLFRAWNNSELNDTLRLGALHQYIWDYYLFTKPDSAFYFASLKYNYAMAAGLKKFAANAANIQGVSYAIRGKDNEARNYYLLSLELNREIGNQDGVMFACGNLGNISRNKGYFDEAMMYFNESVAIAEELKDTSTLASVYNNIGLVYIAVGELGKAQNYLNRSILMHNKETDLRSYSNVLGNMATIYMYYGDYSKALSLLEESAAINQNIANTKSMAVVCSNISGVYSYLRNPEFAVRYARESISYSKLAKDFKTLALGLGSLATLYQQMGLLDSVKMLQYEALSIHTDLKNREGMALSYQSLGSYYFAVKQIDSSFYYLQKSLDINLEMKDKITLSSTYNAFGKVYLEMGNYDESFLYFSKAKQIADSTNSRISKRTSGENLYRLSMLKKDTISAVSYLTAVVKQSRTDIKVNFPILTEKEKTLFFNSLQEDFNSYNSLALVQKHNQPELAGEVFNNTILLKGLLMKSSSALRKSIQQSEDDSLIYYYDSWIQIKKQISGKKSADHLLDSLYAVAESIEKKLVTKSTYFSELDKLFKADWKDIQNKLGKNDVVIEFICFKPDTLCIKKDREENLYCALVLKKDQKYPEMIELCSEIQLQQLLQGYKNTESEKINSLYNDDKLYNLILKPILKNIKKGSNILYSPDGILHRISFPAISDNKGKQLCTQYNLSLLSSSLSLLVNYSPVLKTDFNVLMFGAIDYSDTIGNAEIWEYLPGTLTETEGIKNVLGNSRHKYLLKKDLDATESFVRDSASHYTITHFATHGFYFPDHELLQNAMQTDTIESGEIEFRSNKKSNGRTSFVESKNPLMRAGLAMSSANTVWSIFENINQDDGVLTAFELSMINLLQTKLVVLSACETGLGEIYQNEGVFGMQRALKMAGVEFIIVSLWKVPDTETSEFMIYFYSELIKSMNIRDAFNATQIHFQKIYGPYFWGAFQLVE